MYCKIVFIFLKFANDKIKICESIYALKFYSCIRFYFWIVQKSVSKIEVYCGKRNISVISRERTIDGYDMSSMNVMFVPFYGHRIKDCIICCHFR